MAFHKDNDTKAQTEISNSTKYLLFSCATDIKEVQNDMLPHKNDLEMENRNCIISKNLDKISSDIELSGNHRDDDQQSIKQSGRTCSNCGTSSTSTWRNLEAQLVCNACKCFFRKHGRNRPIHMRKDTVVTRHRNIFKSSVPNEGVLHLDSNLPESLELDPIVLAEAVCSLMHCLKNF